MSEFHAPDPVTTFMGHTMDDIESMRLSHSVLGHLQDTSTFKAAIAQMELEAAQSNFEAAQARLARAKSLIRPDPQEPSE